MFWGKFGEYIRPFRTLLLKALLKHPFQWGVFPDSVLWTLAFFSDSSRDFLAFSYMVLTLLYFLLFFLNMFSNLSNVICPLRQEPWPAHLSVLVPSTVSGTQERWINACWVKGQNWEERTTCEDVLPRGLHSRTYTILHRRQTPGWKNWGGLAKVLKISSLYFLRCFPTNSIWFHWMSCINHHSQSGRVWGCSVHLSRGMLRAGSARAIPQDRFYSQLTSHKHSPHWSPCCGWPSPCGFYCDCGTQPSGSWKGKIYNSQILRGIHWGPHSEVVGREGACEPGAEPLLVSEGGVSRV